MKRYAAACSALDYELSLCLQQQSLLLGRIVNNAVSPSSLAGCLILQVLRIYTGKTE